MANTKAVNVPGGLPDLTPCRRELCLILNVRGGWGSGCLLVRSVASASLGWVALRRPLTVV